MLNNMHTKSNRYLVPIPRTTQLNNNNNNNNNVNCKQIGIIRRQNSQADLRI
jgi:hypothetical protein